MKVRKDLKAKRESLRDNVEQSIQHTIGIYSFNVFFLYQERFHLSEVGLCLTIENNVFQRIWEQVR